MEKIAASLLGALIIGLAIVPSVAADHGTTDSDTYIGPAPLGIYMDYPPYDDTTGVDEDHNIGGAAFSVGDADNVQVEIEDTSGLTTSGLVQVMNEDDGYYLAATDAFCGTSETLSVPSNATTVNVFVGPIDGIVGAEIFAGETPPPVCAGPGTTGTITASWS